MSAPNAADKPCTADRQIPQRPAVGLVATAGTYLTDGTFLYRAVGVCLNGAVETVELEDCYGLDVVQASLADVRARRLQVVRPSPLDG